MPMARISPLMLAPPLIFVGFVLLVGVGMYRDKPNDLPSTLEGRSAPVLEARALGDHPTFDSTVFTDGTVKLVNFWASWCAPCRVEHPNLIALAQQLPVYGVNKSDSADDALGFLAELGNPFTAITTDENGRQSIDWGVYGLPETFVLDGNGKVVLRFVGPITERFLTRDIYPAIERAAAAE